MEFTVYDSSTRRKQPLLVPGAQELSLYVCGPTVYQRIHIGNARPYVTFLALSRYLRSVGVRTRLVINITDVNDKIYAAAREAGVASADLARQATAWYVEDTDRLGLGRPDDEPLASDAIPEIIALIEDLVARDLAYESGGDVLYRVNRFREYGRLSGQQPDQMLADHSRELSAEAGKKDAPLDFVLWKASKSGEDTSWESPWGTGRPGWHIECSAMSRQLLGDGFDVHGGGLDLIFPHHENEVAQSKGADLPFARLWMHSGLLSLGGEKMSKSLGNIRTLQDVLDEVPAWVVLLFFYGASYRSPVDFTRQALEESKAQGNRITEALRRSERYLASVLTRNAGDPNFADPTEGWSGIHEALQDDFNTANAIGELFGLVYDLNTAVNEHATPQVVRNVRATILEFLEVFGLGALVPQAVDLTQDVQDLLTARDEARRKKDFAESDRIRDELHELGYVVRDTSEGTDVVSLDEAQSAAGDDEPEI